MDSKAKEKAGINWASKRSFLVFMPAEWQPGLFLDGTEWVPFSAAGFLRSKSDPEAGGNARNNWNFFIL